MTAGIIQLVANGQDSKFISDNPEITLFKAVYRRHSPFTMEPRKMRFKQDLTYGRTGRVKLKNYGDLLHKLTLYIQVHRVDIQFPVLTNEILQNILAELDIEYTYTGSPSDPITDNPYYTIIIQPADLVETPPTVLPSDTYIDYPDSVIPKSQYDEVAILINQEIILLNDELDSNNNKKVLINIKYLDITTTNGRDFANSVFPILIIGDPYETLFRYFLAFGEDVKNSPTSISNFDNILIKFYNYMIPYLINTDPNYIYIYDNVVFTHVIEFGSYVFNQSIYNFPMKYIFDKALQFGYSESALDTQLDSYKIYTKYFDALTGIKSIITSQNDILTIKTELLDNIKWNNRKNIIQVINIMNLLLRNDYENVQQFRLGFYKKYKFIASNIYDGTNPINVVTSAVDASLTDYFTSIIKVVASVGEPSYINHFYGTYVNTAVNTFITSLRDLFRNTLYDPYFVDINIWKRLKMSGYFAGYEDLDNVYLFDIIPMYVADDIPNMVYTLMSQDLNLSTHASNFNLIGSAFTTTLKASIDDMYLAYDNVATSSIKNYIVGVNNGFRFGSDKVLLALFKSSIILDVDISGYTLEVRNLVNELVTDQLPLTFIIKSYVYKYTQMIYDYTLDAQLRQDLFTFIITECVNRFRSNVIPAYENYKNNNFSLFKIESLNLGSGGATEPAYLDAASSIWYNINNTAVNNFNNLFNNTLLSPTYFNTDLGRNMETALDLFHTLLTDNLYTTTPEYYILRIDIGSSNTFTDLINLYNAMYNSYNNILNLYDEQKNLFNIKYVNINKSRNYYRSFQDIVDILKNEILDNPDKYYPTNYNSPSYGGVLVPQLLQDIENDLIADNLSGLIDEKYIVRADLDNAISNALINNNPYTPATNLYEWFDTYIATIDTSLMTQFDTITSYIDDLNSANQYNEPNIQTSYNSFINTYYLFIYLQDLVARRSSLSIYVSSIVESKETTYNNFIAILDNFNKTIQDKLAIISLDNKYEGSLLDIRLSKLIKSGTPEFAWSKYLGLRLIEKLTFLVGGQTIDMHTDELLFMLYQANLKQNKQDVYNIMHGNIPELYNYDTNNKTDDFMLQVPLHFFFNTRIESSLPMIALKDTDIEVIIKMRDFNEVSKLDENAIITNKPKLSCYLIGEYIYVEHEERKRLVEKRQEYLIESFQHNSQITYGKDNLVSDSDKITSKLFFTNPSKALLWTMKFITLANKQEDIFDWTNKTLIIDGKKVNPILSISLKMNGQVREIDKEFGYYNYVQPYNKNIGSLIDNTFMYSFCINPQDLQPSGHANLSYIEDLLLIITLNPLVREKIANGEIQMIWNTYSMSYNWLRILSGMSSLMYI